MSYHNPATTPRPSATFDDYALSEIRRAAATGIYDIRGGAPSVASPTLTICSSSAPRSRAIRLKATEKNAQRP